MKRAITIIRQQPRILNGLAVTLLLGLSFSYIYFLSLSVVHVVMQKEIDRDISTLRSEISSLEAEYMTAQHRISTEIANRTDLMASTEKIFINKTSPSLVLSAVDGG